MAKTPDNKALGQGESSAYAEDVDAKTREDLSLEDERDALKEARDAQARDGTGGGEGSSDLGNLHFGDQENSDWKNPASGRRDDEGGLSSAGDDGADGRDQDRYDDDDAARSRADRNDLDGKPADEKSDDDAASSAPLTSDAQDGFTAGRDPGQGRRPEELPGGGGGEVDTDGNDRGGDDDGETDDDRDGRRADDDSDGAAADGGGTTDNGNDGGGDGRAPVVNQAPTDIDLSNDTVAENQSGATVATLTAADPDANDTATFSLAQDASGLFEVVGDQLRLKDGASLDHEAQDSYDIVIAVEDSAGNVYSETVTVHVADLNEGPTDIALSNTGVDENNTGAVIATLSSSDPDAGDTARYSIADDPSGLFEVVGDTLKLKDGVALDHEAQESYEITLQVEDSGGATHTETFTINVADLNEGPTELALTGDTINENQSGATVGTLSAFDPDAGDTLTFTVSDDRFEVVDGQLKLKDGVSLDHEEAESIDVTVTATDSGGLSSEQVFTINIADVNESPTDIALSNNRIDENDAGAVVGTLSAADPDVGDTHTFTVSDDRFEVVGDQLKLKDGVSLDHEAAESINVTVTATDSGGLSTEQTFTINIADVNESPTDIALSNNTIDENDAGAVVGTVSAFDPDAGDMLTFTVSDDRFEVVGGQLKLKDGVSLDHETVDAVDITVTATDSGGLETSQSFTINVADVNEAPTDIILSPGGAVGEEFTVNTTTASHQFQPSVAALENGGFVSTWSSLGQDGSSYGVFSQRFDENGEPVGGEVQVNTTSFGSQTNSSVTGLDNGGYVVVWSGPESGGTAARIHGQVFDEHGAPVGGEFVVSSGNTITQTLPDIAALEGGGFVVTWSDYQSGSDYYDVYTRQFEADGTATGDQTLVHDGAAGYQYYSAVEGLADGGYIIAWSDYDFSTGQMDMHAQRYDADGNEVGDSIAVGSGDARFEYSGDIAALPDGGYVITWSAYAPDGNGIYNYDIRAQQFDADGAPVGDEFQVNGVTQGAQIHSAVSATPDGGYMITWGDSSGIGYDIRAQIFDSDANPVGDEFTLNTELASTQSTPDIATLADGSIAVVWQSFSLDGSGYNIAANVVSRGDVVLENTEGGTVVAHLTAVDPDANESFTYSVVGDSPFEVVGDLLVVKEGAALDHETAPEHDVTLQVEDSAGNIYTETVTISVVDVNEGPSDIQLSVSVVNENDAGAVVGTVSAFDPDAGDTLTFTVSDDRFELVGDQLKLKDGVSLDHETAESIDVTVTATDTGGLSSEQVFTINIADVNEAPTDIALSNNMIDENDAGAVVGTVSAFDPDAGDTLTFTVSDDRFEVVGDQLKLKDGVSLDHEAAESIDVTVTATDAGGLSSEQIFTINIADINETPTDIVLSNNTIDENDAGAVVGTLSATDPDVGDTHAFTVSDDRFEVVGDQLKLKDGVELDHEAVSSIDVTVTATDSGGESTSQSFTIAVSNVNEGPTLGLVSHAGLEASYYDIGHSLSDLDQIDFNAAPDATGVVDSIDYMQGQQQFWDGGPGNYFAAKYEGELVVETGGTYTFNLASDDGSMLFINGVAVIDNDGLHGTRTRTVTLDLEAGSHDIEVRYFENTGSQTLQLSWRGPDTGGVNEVIGGDSYQHGYAADSLSLPEDKTGAIVAELTVADPDVGDTHAFTVSDDRFEVVENNGVYTLKLKDGVSIDYETESAVNVSVTVADAGGASNTAHYTIAVEDINAAPEIDLVGGEGLQASYFDIGHSLNDLDLIDFNATPDAEGVVGSLDYMQGQQPFWDGGPGNYFAAKYEGQLIVETGGAYTLSLASDDGSRLYIDGVPVIDNDGLHGTRTRTVTLDLDPGSHNIEVRYFENTGSQTLQLSWRGPDTGGVNEVISGESYRLPGFSDQDRLGLTENTPGDVAAILSITDPDGDAVSHAVSDDRFELVDNANGLALKLKDGVFVDHEAESAITVTVTATDERGESASEVFTIAVADRNDAPTDILLSGDVVNENDAGAVVGTLTAVDQDAGDTHGFAVSDDRFEVVNNNGVYELKLKDGVALDYQAAASVNVAVTATDASGLSVSQTFTINVTDVNEAPTAIALSNDTVDENQPGAVVGALTAADPDAGDAHVFAVSDNRFEVVGNQLKLKDGVALDHEAAESINVTVTATDQGGLSTSQTITINVGDVNEAPGAIGLSNATVDENAAGAVVGALSAADPDAGDTLAFAVSDDRFEVVGGQLKLKDGVSFDHETTAPISLTVTATDTGGLSSEQAFTITIADVNESPTDIALSNNTVDENDPGAVVATLSASDPDAGDTVTFTLTGDPSGLFEIVGDQLKLKDGASLDYETQDVYNVTIQAVDSSGADYSESVTINVADLAEAPTDILLSGDSVNENEAGAVVGTLTAVDQDAGDTHTFAVSDNRFEVVGGQLKLKDGVSLDHETAESINVTVTATDQGGLSTSQAFTINVADVNEAPTAIALSNDTVGENQPGAVVGALSAADPDAGDTHTFAVSDDRFEVVGNQLKLKDGVSLDHEAAESINVTVTTTDQGGLSTSQAFTINVTDVNEAPTGVALSNSTIDENDAGAVVGTLSAADPDAGDTLAFTVSDNRFEVVGDQLKLKDGVSFDHEATASISLTVTAIDAGGLSSQQAFTISIADVNEAPTDIALSNNTIDENDPGAFASTLSAADPDAGDTATFVLAGDPSGLFEIVGGQLKLKDGVSVDSETQNAYDITIQAVDSGGADYFETVTVNVADLGDAPTGFTLQPVAAPESLSLNQDGGNNDLAIATDLFGFPTQALTVEVAFASSQTDVGNGVPLFSYAASGGSHNEALIWLPSSSGQVHIYLAGRGINTGISNAALLDGAQHHFSFTWDQASNELKVYVDGVEEFASSINIRDLRADGTLTFGQEQDREAGSYDVNQIFEGEIFEARIFDYARSGQEIADNAGQPLSGAGAQSGLVSHWLMNGEVGSVVDDVAGHNDLHLHNGAHIKTGAPYDAPTVFENDAGAVVGTLSATDPETDGPVTDFAIVSDASGFFEVVGDQLKLQDGVSLDYETQTSYDLTLEAIGEEGDTAQITVTVNVADLNDSNLILGTDGVDTLYGGDGADHIYGNAGNDTLYGQDGSDVFFYATGDGADHIYGGDGDGWTDTIQLSEGATPLGEFGSDWTISLTQGSIASADANKIVFSEDADGAITFSDNTTLTFSDIEEVII